MVEFRNRQDIRDWAKTRSPEELAIVSARAAARVLPRTARWAGATARHLHLDLCHDVFVALVSVSDPETARLRAVNGAAGHRMSDLEAIKKSDVFLKASEENINRVAADLAAFTVINCAGANAASAVESLSEAAFVVADALSDDREFNDAGFAADANTLDRSSGIKGVFNNPLWGRVPLRSSADYWWNELRARWSKDLETWSFWLDWYEGLLEGRAPDWELWRDVALIEDAHWQAGPEAVAREIARIQAEHLSRRMPLAEELVQDPETGLFEVRPKAVEKPDLLGATLGQVADAIEDVLADPSNGLNERSLDIRKLLRALDRYGNDPQRLEMDFTTVHGSVMRQIAVEDIPASEANGHLLTALQEGAQGIRATDPAVAENRRILQEQAFRELPDAALDRIAEAGPMLQAITQGETCEQMREDVLYLTENMRVGPPRLPGVTRDDALVPGHDEAVRVLGRSARMVVVLRQSGDAVEKIEQHTGYRAARVFTTLYTLVDIGLKLGRLVF